MVQRENSGFASKAISDSEYSEMARNSGLNSAPLLGRYAKNFFSQNGEDGVVLELFNRLGVFQQDKIWACEIGAHNGRHLSNTFYLVSQFSCHSVMIEADPEKFGELAKLAETHKSIIPINLRVESDSESNNLEAILQDTSIPTDFDLLSIDIDSNDTELWASLSAFRPKIVIIEINFEYPPGVVFFHDGRHSLSTFSAAVNVGKDLDYVLACHLRSNLIFIPRELANKVGLSEFQVRHPESLFDHSSLKTHPSPFSWDRPNLAGRIEGKLKSSKVRSIVRIFYRYLGIKKFSVFLAQGKQTDRF